MAETVEYRSSRASQSPTGHEEFPERIAIYRLIRRLGSGGMGTVFEAVDEVQSQRVAIKLIARDYASSEEAVERFRREGRLASAVTHPRCVFVLAVDDHLGRPYIVMELMPGTTLQSLVEKQGPLEPSSAIVKIFDVIEGLQEFHKRGLIHRDVKPSNCFLENEGRVKIGDFGLSKSLGGEVDLTRTGTFIGTPLYASPEQIKRDEVDERTDVYSVAATLYFLLAGRPPVQAKDAAEALARIASEPAPSLRSVRPEIPRALDAVILRGLEREPARRWKNLQEFHDALLPFVPDRLSIAGIGLRVAAYVTDLGFAYLLSWAIVGVVVLYHRAEMMSTVQFYERHHELLGWIERATWLLYFALLEGIGGASLGKWIFGLRVSRVSHGGPPGLGRGLVRASIFYLLTELPADLWETYIPPARGARMAVRLWFSERLIRSLGFLCLWSTMRQQSGFRGPHEWLSGTRVVRLARLRKQSPTRRFRSLTDSRMAIDSKSPAPGHLRVVGPYEVRGAARWEPDRKILVGQDSTLDRPVWIVLTTHPDPGCSSARRALNRQSRPRWIGGGEEEVGRWEAFTAPAGVPLVSLVTAEGLAWRDVLPILRQLADELHVAIEDDTLPSTLSPEQVWLQGDGSVQLVDFLGSPSSAVHDPASGGMRDGYSPSGAAAPGPSAAPLTKRSQQRALKFVGEVARLALEGSRAEPAASEEPASGSREAVMISGSAQSSQGSQIRRRAARIRAAVPIRASIILDRLTGVRPPFDSLPALSRELEHAATRPLEVNLTRRAVHLAFQGFLLLPGLCLIVFLSSGFFPPDTFPNELETIITIPCLWVFWGMLTRGGWSLSMAGISLVHRDGRTASRWAAGLRSLVAWLVPTVLLAGSRFVQGELPDDIGLALTLWFGALLFLVFELALGLLFPRRGLHDWIARTELVPF
jgi:hypothetical protein